MWPPSGRICRRSSATSVGSISFSLPLLPGDGQLGKHQGDEGEEARVTVGCVAARAGEQCDLAAEARCDRLVGRRVRALQQQLRVRDPGDEPARGNRRLGRNALAAAETDRPFGGEQTGARGALRRRRSRQRGCAASRSRAARAPRRRSAARYRTASGRAGTRCCRRARIARARSRARSSDRPCADPAARSAAGRRACGATDQRREPRRKRLRDGRPL